MRRALVIAIVAGFAVAIAAVVYAVARGPASPARPSGDRPVRCDLARTRCRQGAKAVTEPRARARCEVRGRRGTWVPTADAKGVIYACLEPGEGH